MANNTKTTDWSKNHLAQFYTWKFFAAAKQTDAEFDDAADVKIRDLLFFNQAASTAASSVLAGAWAAAMDNYFRGSDVEAGFETGYEWGKATSELAAILVQGKKSLSELAASVDGIYNFVGETKVDGGVQ